MAFERNAGPKVQQEDLTFYQSDRNFLGIYEIEGTLKQELFSDVKLYAL
jgi:hypothetical protein